jgi:hypothetical protein
MRANKSCYYLFNIANFNLEKKIDFQKKTFKELILLHITSMPLIQVTTSDGNVTKLCAANDILGLKEIGNPLIL